MDETLKKLEESAKETSPAAQTKSFMQTYREMQRKSLIEETESAGGYLVPQSYSNEIIPVVRDKAVIMQLSTVLPMTGDTLNVPKISTGSSVYWEQTGGFTAKTTTDQVFAYVTLQPKTIYGLTALSEQLAEDSDPSAVQVVQGDLAGAIAVGMEQAFLEGAGSGADPITGIKNASGVSTAAVGNALTADDLADAISNCEQNGFSPNGFIIHPKDIGTLRKLKDADGQYIWSNPVSGTPASVFGVPVHMSRNMTATDGSRVIYVGDWKQALVGMRRDITLAVSKDYLFNKDQIAVRLTARVAFAPKYGAAFSTITGI